MEEVKKFISENPQVCAAMITAICGILGIFINIVINIWFRNRDYKNKNKIRHIVNMEQYYLPLCDKIERTIGLIDNISKSDKTDIYSILSDKMEALYARDVKLLKKSLEDLKMHFDESAYKFQDDYKLFKIHRKVKNKIWELCQYSENQVRSTGESSLSSLVEELEELIYRIRCCEIKIMADNLFFKTYERFIIWKKYAKRTWHIHENIVNIHIGGSLCKKRMN